MFCREQAVQLHRELAEIERRGGRLAFVGNGSRSFAAGFRDEFGITCGIYVDTKRVSYEALGFRRGGVGTTFRPAVVKNSLRAMGAGFRQGGVQGDAWQLGGVLVVDPDGSVRYRYASAEAGDHAPIRDVLDALGPR
jgi:hypothetical protein